MVPFIQYFLHGIGVVVPKGHADAGFLEDIDIFIELKNEANPDELLHQPVWVGNAPNLSPIDIRRIVVRLAEAQVRHLVLVDLDAGLTFKVAKFLGLSITYQEFDVSIYFPNNEINTLVDYNFRGPSITIRGIFKM